MKSANIWHWRSMMGWGDMTLKCFSFTTHKATSINFPKQSAQPIIILFFCLSFVPNIFFFASREMEQKKPDFYLYQLRSAAAAYRSCWWSHRKHVNLALSVTQQLTKMKPSLSCAKRFNVKFFLQTVQNSKRNFLFIKLEWNVNKTLSENSWGLR